MPNKMNFNSIVTQAESLANNEDAQAFVKAAAEKTHSVGEKATNKSKKSKSKGTSDNNGKLFATCRLPRAGSTALKLFLKEDIANWLKGSSEGSSAVVINYLLRRGIDSISDELANGDVIITQDEMNN